MLVIPRGAKRPEVECIAAFTGRATAAPLQPDVRALFERNILGSLGCAIAALPREPFCALRDQFGDRIIAAVQSIETIRVSDLMQTQAKVSSRPVHPARHPGIQ